MDDFISYISSATTKGFKLVDSEERTTVSFFEQTTSARVLKIEGLSGLIIPVIGEALRKYPPIFTETWSFHLSENKNFLVLDMTALLDPMDKMQ